MVKCCQFFVGKAYDDNIRLRIENLLYSLNERYKYDEGDFTLESKLIIYFTINDLRIVYPEYPIVKNPITRLKPEKSKYIFNYNHSSKELLWICGNPFI
jgi:hypothetical protein